MNDKKQKAEDRDTGYTLIGFGAILGVPTGIAWAFGVSGAAPFVGVSILCLLVGAGYRAISNDSV